MTLLHEIEWAAPLIEPYRDPDAEALMRKKYGFVMDSVAFYSRSPWIVRSQVRFDIQRDATALSEGMEPALLVQILNGYFARMSRAIAEYRGHVSKFIGNGILALFGALEPNPWHAVRAALAMREALEEYNEELALAGQPALRVGIGLHRGVAVAGVIGSEELVEFTVVGSTVNLASRVVHLTRRQAADILITAAVREVLDARFALQELPAAAVAGISEPVVTYAVEGVLPG
jgi:class 3 adenylate cyclase